MKTAAVAWMLFMLVGIFVSLVLPLGEGFDEPWHFGYIQYVAQTGSLPSGPHLHLSIELEQFLLRHPMGWRLRDIFPTLRTQEDYWQQPESARLADDRTILGIRFSGSYREAASKFTEQYESHQAPLYYIISAVPFRLIAMFRSLPDTFLGLRIWSLLLASTVVPLSYCLAKRVSYLRSTPEAVAALVALFPGIYPDIARVSNDALLVPLCAATLLALSRFLESRSKPECLALGLLLLAGLCTKALFVPILLTCFAILVAAREYSAAMTVAITSGAGWVWYIRNISITGSLTGLPETVSAKSTVLSSIHSIATIHWLDVLKLAAVSHIWMGNWSLLQYRSWIYQTVIVFFFAALVSFLFYLRQAKSRTLASLSAIYLLYGISLLYYATQVFQETHIPVIQGWYLSPLVPFEALSFVMGAGFLLRQRVSWSIIPVGVCFLALIVYGNAFIAAPYYSGMIRHVGSGHLQAYHPRLADISIIDSRLIRFHPWIPAETPVLSGIGVILTGLFLLWTYYNSSRT